MIYAEKSHVSDTVFLDLLEKTKCALANKLCRNKILTALEFETLACETMQRVAVGTEFEGTVKQTNAQSFPDIIAGGYFGIEVKVTVKDHWVSIGNSILESLRIEDVEKIYILFGKFGGEPGVRYRLYQECLPDISVTHSPRYKINMELAKGRSIFDKIGIDYDILRKRGDIISQIKDFYRHNLGDGEGLWWIDDESEAPSPVVKQFRTLGTATREEFKVDCFILFPELFTVRANYERAATYMITAYGAVSTSLRDAFSAGGKLTIMIDGKSKEVSQLLGQLYSYAGRIRTRINSMSEESLKTYWRTDVIQPDRLSQWLVLIDAAGGLKKNDAPSQVFHSGLQNSNQ